MSNVIRPLSTFYSSVQQQNIIKNARSELDRVGRELSTGLKADVARDLGMKSAQSYNFRNLMQQNEQYLTSNKLMDNKLEVLADSVGKIREDAQEFLNLTVSNTSYKTQTASALQLEAKAKLDSIIRSLNTNYNGDFLFSGLDSDKQAVTGRTDVNTNSGFSPEQVMQNIIGGGITNLADANAKISEIDQVFDSNYPTDPNQEFEETFYNGTDLLDGTGTPNARVSSKPDETTKVEYGIQANDPEFKSILKGLYMLSSVDASQINDEDAYKTWVNKAANEISNGIKGIINTETKLGGHQKEIVQAIEIQEDKRIVLNNRVTSLEGVDLFEAQTRMTALETQLQATFSTTARLSKLSFLNYMN
jgi:flagellar hook-associated protein 3 FlgL